MPIGRARAALATGALLVVTVPWAASATAPHLTCGPKVAGRWETIPVPAFHAVSGLSAPDTITAYAVDTLRPQDVAVTNGVRVQVSHSHGCGWDDAVALDPGATTSQPFVGSGSSIVSLAMLQGRMLAAVREGEGSGSRPHVLRYDGETWSTSDNGLPPAGVPHLLRTASDGRTAYLAVSPTATGGPLDGLPQTPVPLPSLPTLPVDPTGGSKGSTTGLLYATTDGGASWQLRTGPGAVPGGANGFDQLEVDPRNANWVYALSRGTLLVSQDGGSTFTALDGSGFTAFTVMLSGIVVGFDGDGHGQVFFGTHKGFPFAAPKGVTSAAYRDNDTTVMVESGGQLADVGPFGQGTLPVPAPTPARPGSLLGDLSAQSSFHALSGHALLRYVDPVPQVVGDPPPIAVGDASVRPPLPGVVLPDESSVSLLLGQSATRDFTLELPKNPTPLDLFFLVDVSTSMSTYIDNLKQNIQKVVDVLQAAKIDLYVGIGTLGTAPAKGEPPYPDAYAYPPNVDATGQVSPSPPYRKPRIYELIQKLARPSATLHRAINSLQLETDPPAAPPSPSAPPQQDSYHEGQLLALEQAVTGSGIRSEQDEQAHLSTYSLVRPGQQAGFRAAPDVRRVIVLASDEAFETPYPTPIAPGPSDEVPRPEFTRTLKILNDNRVGVFGVTAGSPDAIPDMTTLAAGTHTVSPRGGVSCGGDPEQRLPAGAPLVCSQEGDFSSIIAAVLARLTDRQDVHLVAPHRSPVLRHLDEHALSGLDVKQANSVPFSVTLSCAGVQPGTYAQEVKAMLRGYPVGSTVVYVSCLAPQAAAPPVPLPPFGRPPVAPAVEPPPPPPPPPPAAQPQPQPQPNLNPLTAGVTQEQQEAQLAVALQEATRPQEDEQGTEQLAMVDRRRRQEVQALGVLAVATALCAGLGLARLRARTQPGLRQAR